MSFIGTNQHRFRLIAQNTFGPRKKQFLSQKYEFQSQSGHAHMCLLRFWNTASTIRRQEFFSQVLRTNLMSECLSLLSPTLTSYCSSFCVLVMSYLLLFFLTIKFVLLGNIRLDTQGLAKEFVCRRMT